MGGCQGHTTKMMLLLNQARQATVSAAEVSFSMLWVENKQTKTKTPWKFQIKVKNCKGFVLLKYYDMTINYDYY